MISLRKKRKPPSIPLSAMGDIAFLLLIFYMATTMVTDQKPRDIAVPEIESKTLSSPYPIIIYLDRELASRGMAFFFNKEIPIKELPSVLQERAGLAPSGSARFYLNIEKNLEYRYMHQIIQTLKEAGVRKVIITTRPPDGTGKK